MDVKFLGDSLDIISSFPPDVKEDLGGDLRRLQNGERALDSAPMGAVLPGVFELRADDKDFWYRVFYCMRDGVISALLHEEYEQDFPSRHRNRTQAFEGLESTTGEDEKALR
jgi:phage-related protein